MMHRSRTEAVNLKDAGRLRNRLDHLNSKLTRIQEEIAITEAKLDIAYRRLGSKGQIEKSVKLDVAPDVKQLLEKAVGM